MILQRNNPKSSQDKKKLTYDRVLLILSGILLGISFPPFPAPFYLFMFVALVPLIIVIERRLTLASINKAVYLTGFVFSLITLYWVGSWQPKADPFLMISGIALVLVNPLFFMIPATIYYHARKIIGSKALYLLPFFWVFYEYLYMLTDASFPWLVLGNGLSKFLLFIQAADIIGALGISLVIVFINVFLFLLVKDRWIDKKKSWINLIIPVSIFILMLVYGFVRIGTDYKSNEKVRLGLIQPNLDPWDKCGKTNVSALTGEYLQLSRKALNQKAELIIFPETALPVYLLSGTYSDAYDSIINFVNRNNLSILTGMPHIIYYGKNEKMPKDVKYNKAGDYNYATYNSILLFSPNNFNIPFYGKNKLVPFGERVPFVDALPFLGDLIKWGVGLSGWNVGYENKNFNTYIPNKDSLSINGLVCYESIYPFYNSQFIKDNGQLIAVVTNDSWYGNSSGPYQHKEIAVLRAIENRRYVVRAANGGISAIIDPSGKTVSETKMFEKAVLVGDIYKNKELSFFTRYPQIISIISSFISILFIFLAITFKIRSKVKK